MTSDDLPTTKHASLPLLQHLDLMAQLLQTLDGLLADALFHVDAAVEDFTDLGHASANADARRIERGLGVEVEGEHVEQDLDVALGLHEAAHDAVHGVQGAIRRVGDHGRDDGVVGPLARGEDVGVTLAEGEVGTAVLQRETAPLGDDAGAETAVVAVDEGHAIAFFVRHGEVDRVAVVVGGTAVVQNVQGLGRVEEFRPFSEVGLGNELLRGDLFDVRVCHPPGRVCEGDAETLDDGVEVLG